ncbi:hypothetical protein [Hyalangium rubrum]|uniref:Uncharacterized protein n=1 Tax=Hyalangium rubrum TaxID=3103134 RepID=A0ABU5HBB5_9BACT|nr:hypothetical protein [Hyalangium sp. s54d21]MDY7230580.1 hypothetical protein [Hyalangium sp. s54d21]
MSPKSPGILDPLRVRVRRFQFIVGLGFISLVVGAMFTGSLTLRMAERVQELPDVLQVLVAVSLENLWLLGVLPALCYGSARILELKPLSTALGAAFAGQFFYFALQFVSNGLEGMWAGWLPSVLRAVAFSSGVFFSYRAVVNGRAASARIAAQAQAQAQAKKSEYMDFLREAERGGEKSAQREAERTAAPAALAAPVEGTPAAATSPALTEAPAAPVAPTTPTDAPVTTAEAPAEAAKPPTGS